MAAAFSASTAVSGLCCLQAVEDLSVGRAQHRFDIAPEAGGVYLERLEDSGLVLEHRFSANRNLDSQQGRWPWTGRPDRQGRAEDFHQALAQQLLVKSTAGQVAEVPVGLASVPAEDTRAEEHQQPKTGLPGRLCQRLLGNHGPILRDPQSTPPPHARRPGFPASGHRRRHRRRPPATGSGSGPRPPAPGSGSGQGHDLLRLSWLRPMVVRRLGRDIRLHF